MSRKEWIARYRKEKGVIGRVERIGVMVEKVERAFWRLQDLPPTPAVDAGRRLRMVFAALMGPA